MARVGVIICHCGTNIAPVVDVESLKKQVQQLPRVVFCATHQHTCSPLGQAMIKEAISSQRLDRLVIAACTPRLHEATFRRMLEQTALNPYMLEIANIREQCSWVHKDTKAATAKALDLVSMAVAKVLQSRPLFADKMPVHKKCLVVGGGISGIQAALDIAEAGYGVTLVEKEAALGGKMIALDKTFPGLDCAACVVAPKIGEIMAHPGITLLCSSQIKAVSGKVGSFSVTISCGDNLIKDTFGAIIIATGYDLLNWAPYYPEYGGGAYANILNGLEFEAVLNASGSTGGKIICPQGGAKPESVVIVQCVGSRDPSRAKAYCSRACCMYGAKHARQILQQIPGAKVYVFYVDIRAYGKGYEEFYTQARAEGALFIRGRVAKIFAENGKLICWGEDTLSGQQVSVSADLVILETAMIPSADTGHIAALLGISTDKDGWLSEAHPKLRPVETQTPGVFICGAAQGPKDISDTVAQASAAAAKVLGLLAKEELIANPLIAQVDALRCGGCGFCAGICPVQAISMIEGEGGTIAQINAALCTGCGACAVACRNGCLDMPGYSNKQLLEEVDALWHR